MFSSQTCLVYGIIFGPLHLGKEFILLGLFVDEGLDLKVCRGFLPSILLGTADGVGRFTNLSEQAVLSIA